MAKRIGQMAVFTRERSRDLSVGIRVVHSGSQCEVHLSAPHAIELFVETGVEACARGEGAVGRTGLGLIL